MFCVYRVKIQIARSTMCDWVAQLAMALEPLYQLMVQQVKASKVIHTEQPDRFEELFGNVQRRTDGGGGVIKGTHAIVAHNSAALFAL